jgi:hypothetical protein
LAELLEGLVGIGCGLQVFLLGVVVLLFYFVELG